MLTGGDRSEGNHERTFARGVRPARRGDVLLVVEDDLHLRQWMARVAERHSLRVLLASDYHAALTMVAEHAPRNVLLDVNLPGGNGVDLIPSVRAANPEARIVIFTAYASIVGAVGAVRMGAYDYLPKPATPEQILTAFGIACDPSPAPVVGEQPMTLARSRWEHIRRVLSECGGNISTAARTLGIKRQSLQRMLKKFPPP